MSDTVAGPLAKNDEQKNALFYVYNDKVSITATLAF